MNALLDLFLHLDRHLIGLAAEYGVWIYALLFLVIFCETGLVVMPFLPGDSLLFATGVLASTRSLSVATLAVVLTTAAVLGDTVNYGIGQRIGLRVFGRSPRARARSNLRRTQRFFARHGGKAIILARFVPVLRTFAPFAAGLAGMEYRRFLTYNLVGGVLWISIFLFSGYFFGNLPVVREHFALTLLAVVVLSTIPVLLGPVGRHAAARFRSGRPASGRLS